MKRAVFLTALLLTVFSASAIVGYDGPKNQPHILGATDSSDNSVSLNGSDWNINFAEEPAGPTNQSTGVENYSFDDYSVQFSGTFQVPNPCHTLEPEVEKRERLYILNITEKGTGNGSTACTPVISYINFTGVFETDQAFRLKVMNEGELVRALEHPDYMDSPRETGLIQGFIDWLTGFL